MPLLLFITGQILYLTTSFANQCSMSTAPIMSSNMRQRQLAQSYSPRSNPEKPTAQRSLLSWDHLPEWYKDNEYIKHGFRPTSNSYLDSFRSCFYVHNETGNIYSHFLAMLWMIALPVAYYPYVKRIYPDAGSDDWFVFSLFFLGGALCFGLSTVYHILSNHSNAIHDVYLRLDLLGISIVTAGCFPSGMWYTFPCSARSTKMFWISVCSNSVLTVGQSVLRYDLFIGSSRSILLRRFLRQPSFSSCAAFVSRPGVQSEVFCSHSWLRRLFTLSYTLASCMGMARWTLRLERLGMLLRHLCI